MKNVLLSILIAFIIVSCGKKEGEINKSYKSVEVETLLQDSLLNVRALETGKKHEAVFASSSGKLGLIFEETDWREKKDQYAHAVISEVLNFKYDSIVPNFRAISNNGNNIFLISIGNPALLFKVNDKDILSLVYKEEHETVFYDSMDFWNDKEGIAIGDSIGGCLSIIITRDGGNTWVKLTCEQLPPAKVDEGAFAASDTNIAIVGNKAWVATTSGRIYYSEDKGNSWTVTETPIIKDGEAEGIYSIDFYDELNGFAIGGDYTKPADSSANKIRTSDGGKTWQLVAENKSPGYRSCVQYVPNGAGKELVTLGFNGIDYSNDSGDTWTHLSDEGFYTLRFLNDSVAYAAGRGRISKLTFRE